MTLPAPYFTACEYMEVDKIVLQNDMPHHHDAHCRVGSRVGSYVKKTNICVGGQGALYLPFYQIMV
jgi:hypothetical protein